MSNSSFIVLVGTALLLLLACSEELSDPLTSLVEQNSSTASSPLIPSPSDLSSAQGDAVDFDVKPESDLPPLQSRIQALLIKANPNYQGQGQFHEQGGEIVAAEFPRCGLRNLTPLRGLNLRMLDLSGNPVREIRHLKGMPLNKLFLENTAVESLRDLRDAKLIELRLNDSPVESLDGIQGQPLENLYAVGTRITSVEPLKHSNLRGLWLTGSPVSDLSPLAGLPIQSLTAHRTLVNDLSFIRKLPVIQRLHIGDTLIEDLTPLEGLRLTRLVFTPQRIKRGLEVARRLSALREIGTAFDDQRRDLMAPDAFWAQFRR